MENSSTYQSIKIGLKAVLKQETFDTAIKTINEKAIMMHRIMTHTLMFVKLYFIHLHENKRSLPKLCSRNSIFLDNVVRILCKKDNRGKKPGPAAVDLQKELGDFYNEHYKPLIPQSEGDLCSTHLNTSIDYMIKDIVTMYENNIKQHFVQYVERFVNVICDKRGKIKQIKESKVTTSDDKEKATCALRRELSRVKYDILYPNQIMQAHNQYHEWIAEIRGFLPQRSLDTETQLERALLLDLAIDPQKYVPFMMYMMSCMGKKNEYLYNLFPLRTEMIPKHFRIDTTTLVHMFSLGLKDVNPTATEESKSKVWEKIFNLHKKCFHSTSNLSMHENQVSHKFTFDHQIETDGFSCTILLKRIPMPGQPDIPVNKKRRVSTSANRSAVGPSVQDDSSTSDIYIDALTSEQKQQLQGKKVVAIDPNMRDLLYCIDSDVKNSNEQPKTQHQFRYTQDTRRREMHTKKQRKRMLRKKRSTTIDDRTVIQWETSMRPYNKKTLNFFKFKEYIKHKNLLNFKLATFYNQRVFRGMHLFSYSCVQKTEARMLNKFKEQFGAPGDVVICIGDWSQRSHRRFHEPTKGKGFRTLFKKAGYQVFLVDEYRTSCRCSKCGANNNTVGVCSKFKYVINPRPYNRRKRPMVLRHGLLQCGNCDTLWNRDVNSAVNIWRIASAAIYNRVRPEYLNR